jgi:ferredoxin
MSAPLPPILASARCVGCGDCALACGSGAMRVMAGRAWLKEGLCEGCHACIQACHHQALLDAAMESKT